MDPVEELSNVIDESLQKNSLDRLNHYLASLTNSEEVLNGKLILVFVKFLKKGGKHERKTLQVNSIVTCMRHFVNTITDPQKWEKVSEDISKLCELIFVISSSCIKEDIVIQTVVDMILRIAENVDCVVDNLLKFLAKTLMASSVCMTHKTCTRLHIMNLVGSLLQKSTRGIRSEIFPSTIDQLKDISNALSECDDYETQISVVEILARSLNFINEDHLKSFFSNNTSIRDMFMKYQPFLNFDPDCRLFLNEVNESLGDQQKVFSVPCMVVSADDCRLRKPNDPAYSDFWVDFNLGSKSISFYYQLNISESWELMTVPQDKVTSAVAKDSTCQSKSGDKFEAVKLELTIKSSNLSQNSELPQKLKIYPRKEHFLKIEPFVQKIFNRNYETEVVQKVQEQKSINKSFDSLKSNETQEEKSYIATSTLSKFPEDTEEENDSSKMSEQADEEAQEDSLYTKYIKENIMEEAKNRNVTNISKENKTDETQNNYEKVIIDKELYLNEQKSVRRSTHSDLQKNIDGYVGENVSCESAKSKMRSIRSSSEKSLDAVVERFKGEKQKNVLARDVIKKIETCKTRDNTSKLKSSSIKKRLYCFEKSNAEDVIMSSQDQVLPVEIPSYKITKKETFTKPQPNLNRKNVSYSYIINKENEKSAIATKHKSLKQYSFEEDVVTRKSLSDDDCSGSSSESSPKIFQDTQTNSQVPTKQLCSNFCSKKPKKDIELKSLQQKYTLCPESAYSDFRSPERKESLKSMNTYGRTKPNKQRKRIRAMQVESSDSDSQHFSPPKISKEDEEIKKFTHESSTFAASVKKDKIDPIRDKAFSNEIKVKLADDFEEPAMKTKNIVAKLHIKPGKVAKKIPVKRVMRIESSDSDSQCISPPKLSKEDKEANKFSHKKTRFAASVEGKIDPIRDKVFLNEIELKVANDFEEPAIKRRNIIPELHKKPGKVTKKLPVKNTNVDCKKTTTKQTDNKKKPDPKKQKQEILQELSENLTNCLNITQYDPPEETSPLEYEDLGLNAPRYNDDQQKMLVQTTFKVNDMVRFGKLLMKQIQEKVVKADELAQKEREINLATFDYKVQASCSGLYGNCQKLESVGDKLEKLDSILQTTFKLHKEIAAQINSESSKIEEAKNELMKNVKKNKKTESSKITAIFQEVGGYLKKIVFSLIPGYTNKNAITN